MRRREKFGEFGVRGWFAKLQLSGVAVYNSQGTVDLAKELFDLRRRESERGGASALGEQDVQDWRGF